MANSEERPGGNIVTPIIFVLALLGVAGYYWFVFLPRKQLREDINAANKLGKEKKWAESIKAFDACLARTSEGTEERETVVRNLIVVRGSVPGANGGVIVVRKTVNNKAKGAGK